MKAEDGEDKEVEGSDDREDALDDDGAAAATARDFGDTGVIVDNFDNDDDEDDVNDC